MSENTSIKILSDLTVFAKYAKYIPEIQRRETWDEICDRVQSMHIKKYPMLEEDIIKAFKLVRDKKVVPSMRSMQFAGKPIDVNNSRLFNCSFSAIQTWKDFQEAMFLLLSGVGFAYSVQRHHIEKLPHIKKPTSSKKYLIGDSIEGWADAIRALFKAYMAGGYLPLFDYRDIRPKGTQLITAGGKAPGPEPLERCLNKIKSILDKKDEGTQLLSIDVHDIICHIADAVLSGGIRRAACLVLFDNDDMDMLNCKSNFKVEVLNGGFHFNSQTNSWTGEVLYKGKAQFLSLDDWSFKQFNETKQLPWYYFEPQRARANNSVLLLRNQDENKFEHIWELVKNSGAGEPGFLWSKNKDCGTNPCLTGDSIVKTEDGEITIKELIDKFKNNEKTPKVFTFNELTKEIELNQLLNGDLTRKMTNIIKLTLKDGTELKLTPDHKIFTENRGWIEAAKLKKTDKLIKIL